jgi:hypothetical protein
MPDIYEKSTAKVTATFLDYNNLPFTPVTLFYSMYTSGEREIIARTEVTSGLSTTYSWLFYGSNLDISDPRDDGIRILVLDGTFDSVDQSNLPFVAQYELPQIKDVMGK